MCENYRGASVAPQAETADVLATKGTTGRRDRRIVVLRPADRARRRLDGRPYRRLTDDSGYRSSTRSLSSLSFRRTPLALSFGE